MFMHKSKKGFTIVELVIVIAVIAILAAVLIPTFSNLVKKANIANDTALAKNINTALTAYKATNAGDMEFEDVIAAARDAGYIISNLNPTTAGHYFVWEKSTNQILLVDGENAYKVIYANNEKYAPIGASWYFATSNKTAAAALKADAALASANIKDMIANVADLSAAIAAGGEIYLDESVVLDKNNLLVFDQTDKDIVVNLGNSQLTSDGTLEDSIPIQIKEGSTVTLNGGIVGAAGSAVDLDGKVYATPITGYANSNVIINDTQFNAAGGPIQFEGTAVLNNVTANTYFYSYGNGNVTLNNCVATSNDVVIWVTNTIKKNGNTTYDGTSTLTVNSGSYTSTVQDAEWGAVSVLGGTIVIKDGDFSAVDGHMFAVKHANGKIVLEGGTFNGKSLSALGTNGIKAMCAAGNVTESNGVYTITK